MHVTEKYFFALLKN